jgi:hypothetical protein
VSLCDYWAVRVKSPDGEWTIDVIHLTLTGTHRDGEWLRVRHWGMHFADLRTVEQLAEVVDLARLEEVLRGAAAGTVDTRMRAPANTGALARLLRALTSCPASSDCRSTAEPTQPRL